MGPLTPENGHSPAVHQMHDAYVVIAIVAVLIVVAINAGLVMAVLRARQGGPIPTTEEAEAPPKPARFPQRAVMAALGVLAVAIFVIGVVYNERAREAPSPLAGSTAPISVRVAGQQWLWRYTYPDGTFSYYELVVPVDRTVRLKIDSTDVVHRWFVPELDGMAEAVPGRLNQIYFRADRAGVYDGQSTAFSGSAYAAMRIRVRAVEDAEYRAWLATQKKDLIAAQQAVQKALGEPQGAATTPSAPGTPGVSKVQPGGQS